MPCRLCDDKLLEFLYGELEEDERVAFEQHLEASEPCRNEYLQLKTARETVAAAPGEPVPPTLHTRVMAHATEQAGQSGRRPWWARISHPAAATVAVSLVAALVYVYTLKTGEDLPTYESPKLVLQDYEEIDEAEPTFSDPVRQQGLGDRPGETGSRIMAETAEPYSPPAEGKAMKSKVFPPRTDRLSPLKEEATLGFAARRHTRGADEQEQGESGVPLTRIAELTADDRCSEATSWMYIYLAQAPEAVPAGRAWMQLARCYLRVDNLQEARRAARNASDFPSSRSEAETFLQQVGQGE